MKRKFTIIKVTEEIQVSDIILEAGDKIKIFNEQTKGMEIFEFKDIIEKYKFGATDYNLSTSKATYVSMDKPYEINWYDEKNTKHLFFGTKTFEVGISWDDIIQIEQYDEKEDDVIIVTTAGMYFYFATSKKDLSFI